MYFHLETVLENANISHSEFCMAALDLKSANHVHLVAVFIHYLFIRQMALNI